jgi:hypothetical protein
MRADIIAISESQTHVELRLSRRNLQVLLAKLDGHPPGSACTLERDDGSGVVFRVIAEQDREHYGDRAPGDVHPESLKEERPA